VGFLLACFLPAALPADWFHARLWKGYYTVFLRAPAEPHAAAWGLGPLVSRQTACVGFNTFAGLASIRVAELPERLDTADPRLDPFLRRVSLFFQAPLGQWMYARTPRGPLLAELGRLGPGLQVLELDPLAVLIRLLLLAAASLLVLLPARVPHVPRWLFGFGLLPWILLVSTGDLRDLLAFLLLFPSWVRAMAWAAARQPGSARQAGLQSGTTRQAPAARGAGAKAQPARALRAGSRRRRAAARRGKSRRRTRHPAWLAAALRAVVRISEAAKAAALVLAAKPLIPTLAVLGAAVFFLAAPGVRHLPGALFALAADLCLLAMLPIARRWEHSRRTHPLFRALPILGELRAAGGRRRKRLPFSALAVPAALAVLALASAGALRLESGRRGLCPPRPEPSGLRGLSWRTLAALPLSTETQTPPHLADFLAHLAYQQSLAFQRPYRFPSPGERIYVSHYEASAAGYAQSRRVARRFAEAWLPEALAAAAPGSVERLLADQGRPAAVRRASEPQLQRELAPWPRAAAVALFLLACLTASIRFGTRTFAL
jgi:hypothetical protein